MHRNLSTCDLTKIQTKTPQDKHHISGNILVSRISFDLRHNLNPFQFCREVTKKILMDPERSDKKDFISLAFKLEVI